MLDCFVIEIESEKSTILRTTRRKGNDMMNRTYASEEAVGYTYLPLIVEQLQPLHPWKIILFGSYAYGKPDNQSDIDLLVVLNSEHIPQSFHDNMQNKLLVRKALWELSKQVSIDLVVHTNLYETDNS
jgi:predicted nucleotidyltransferase